MLEATYKPKVKGTPPPKDLIPPLMPTESRHIVGDFTYQIREKSVFPSIELFSEEQAM